MKQLCVVVVLIWYICVHENYLFTRADKLITLNLNDKVDVPLSCNTSSRIRIVNISIGKASVSSSDTKCKLNAADIGYIHRTCNERSECTLGMEWSTPCIREYGYYNVSYKCNATCNFEESKCEFDTSSTNEIHWRRVQGRDIPSIIAGSNISFPDHTMNTIDGYLMMIKSEKNRIGTMKTQTFHYESLFCLSFWYFSYGYEKDYGVNVELYIINKEGLFRTKYFKANKRWHFFQEEIYIRYGDFITFRSSSKTKSDVLFGLDDFALSSLENCEDNAHIVTGRLSTGGSVTLPGCPSFFLNNLNIELTYDQSSQVCRDAKDLTQSIGQYCGLYYRWRQCTFTLENITKDDTCLQPNKELNILYQCSNATVPSSYEITTLESQRTTYATVPSSYEITTLESQRTTFNPDNFQSSTPSSTPVIDYPDNFRSSTPSSNSVTGIVVGVVLSVVTIAVCLVVAVIFFRRSRYFEKKANPIVVEKNNHSDYTGHQNVAFSPEVNGNTQTDYCEIRTSKHNEQYHDISDTFRPLINTANDDEYSEIANVVNSPNNNPNPSTNYQHQYISLDPNATGFDRSIPQNSLHNESKNNQINSNEMASFTGGDDYAILDPDDLNESKKDTPKVLPLSDNYVVLDPNETGFNRQESTDTVCNYELATSINPKETSEDPYDGSKDETYDTSCNSRHKEKENNIYSHTVDNVYDTAGNQRKKEESDATYDHFFGQQSEDDNDISKPL